MKKKTNKRKGLYRFDRKSFKGWRLLIEYKGERFLKYYSDSGMGKTNAKRAGIMAHDGTRAILATNRLRKGKLTQKTIKEVHSYLESCRTK